jgi:TRAP-type C4-dicarboxylate transport system substrate-binding protein
VTNRPAHRRSALVLTTTLAIAACGGADETTDQSVATKDHADAVTDQAINSTEPRTDISPTTASVMTSTDDEAEVVTLVAVHNSHETNDQMVAFAEQVRQRSGGTLEITFHGEWRMDDVEFEAGTIADVQAGEFDIGWLGARAFDEMGVNSFQALLAPLLVDSHDLQEAVFRAGIPGAMLDGLDDAGLAGIGVLPGPMRKLLGVSTPLTKPADFAGMTIGHQDSTLAHQTLTALGAIADARKTGSDLNGLDGYEQHLDSILGNHYEEAAGYVTANINLWPRPSVIFMNQQTFDSLSPAHQAALGEAATAVVADARAAAQAEDTDVVPVLCDEGLTFVIASDSDLDDLRAALEPVYSDLASDPQTKTYLDAISSLKTQLGAPPDSARCPPPEASTDAFVTAGRYESANTFALVVTATSLTILDPSGEIGFKGRYTVAGDQIEVSDGLDTVIARWSFDGHQLTFTDVTPENSPFEALWEAHPWLLTQAAG